MPDTVPGTQSVCRVPVAASVECVWTISAGLSTHPRLPVSPHVTGPCDLQKPVRRPFFLTYL